MPNWCSNELRVTCDTDDEAAHAQLEKFMKMARRGDYVIDCEITKKARAVEGCDLSLQSLYPCPEQLVDTTAVFRTDEAQEKNMEVYGYKSWYDWRIAKWGCKWDVDGHIEDPGDLEWGYLKYFFDSAWSPPTKWLEKVSGDYPLLHFELHYDEPGMCFKGVATCKAGDMNDQYIEYGRV